MSFDRCFDRTTDLRRHILAIMAAPRTSSVRTMSTFRASDQTQLGPSEGRLETPATAGFQRGMSSSGVIGRKLGSIYEVESQLPQEMDYALRDLRNKLSGTD
jgi:hypothetical protein